MEETKKHRASARQEPGRRYILHDAKRPSHVGPRAYRSPELRQQKVDVAPTPPKADTSSNGRNISEIKPAAVRTKRSMVLRRQMVERAQEQRVVAKKKRNLHALWYVFVAAIICAAGVVIWSFRDSLPFDIELFKQHPAAINSIESKPSGETYTLDEAPISAAEVAANIVTHDAPKTLRIPGLGINARIRQVGTTLSGEPIAPKNIYDVGWYEGSSRPGNDGAVLLNGHLAGPTKPGVFSGIETLQVGEQVVIERGDGQILTYIVSRIQEYTAGQIDMSSAITSVDPTRKGLNLVTTLNKFSGTEKRIIIFTVQQSKN